MYSANSHISCPTLKQIVLLFKYASNTIFLPDFTLFAHGQANAPVLPITTGALLDSNVADANMEHGLLKLSD